MIVTLAAICWHLTGVASFVYWWTKEYNFTFEEVLPALCTGPLGLIGFVMCYFVYSSSSGKVLIKRRGQ